MFGKGAKRKLDQDEEGLEGKALAAAAPDGLSKVSYTLQRQTIFNISLMKLYNQRPLREPALERRVLINNMLRRIQEELKQEGSLRPLLLPPSPPPDDPMDEGFREASPSFGGLSLVASTPFSQQSSVLSPATPFSPHPLTPPTCQSVQSGPATLESCLTPASLLEEDGDASFCTSTPPTPPLSPSPPPGPLPNQVSSRVPVPAIHRDTFSLSLNDKEDLCPPLTVPSAVADTTHTTSTSLTAALTQPPQLPPQLPPLQSTICPTTQPKDCTKTGSPKGERQVVLADGRGPEAKQTTNGLPAPPSSGLMDVSSSPSSSVSSSPSSSSGFLSDLALDDILFADIDTSMYDFDPCTTSASAPGVGLSKLSPMVTADDLLKTLSSPYSGPAPQVTPNQPFKIDLSELDHIMEVLVGS
ncbi:SERTA domain-containing protein 2b isoform X2 [Hypomesus transpacificus]|nr:SERTA domain-containing protein 2b isoform X2 [Hypomesus transpacificus]XP_046884588.1 SERTA domain-containing protein 2b isoform X2 [Hypomesus transpacificus]